MLYTTPAVFSTPDKLIVTWTESVSGAGEKEFVEALREFKKSNYKASLKQFEQLVINYPESEAASIASLYTGSIYHWFAIQDKNKDEKMLMSGIRSFQLGIRTCPLKEKGKIPEMLLELGKTYLDLHMFAEAEGSFNRVVKEYPSTDYAENGQYLLAITNINKGAYNEALSDLNLLMFKYKKGMERDRVFLTGKTLLSLNEFGDAKKYFDEGVRKWPGYVKGNPKILHDYSECQFQNGEVVKAREGFITLYNLYPADEYAGFALKRAGETFALSGKKAMAEKVFLDVINYFHDSNEAFESMLALGDIKFQVNSAGNNNAISPSKSAFTSYQDSLKYYKDVETLSGNDLLINMSRLKRARVMEVQGKCQEAFDVYSELIGHPDKSLSNEASVFLSTSIERIGTQIRDRLDRGDKQGVLMLYHACYKNYLPHIKDEGLLMEIALMHEGLHLNKYAHMIYDRIIEINGSRKEQALFNSGSLFGRTGEDRKSVDQLGRFISEYPKSGKVNEARAMSGYGLYNLKEYDKAGNHFYKVMRDAPYRYPDVYLKLATILLNSAQNEDSIAVLRDMLGGVRKQANSDAISQGYILLGNAYYGMQRYQEAMDAYRAGIVDTNLKEDSDSVEFMIGDCLLRLGRSGEAKKVFSGLTEGTNKLIKQASEERLKDIVFGAEGL
ncbi:MAG: tetratricopeptide repeat protein [Nitrospirae bacterium]|nr:tetratricopeptide repeat protein [Nitrospirota bacterium]